MKPLHQRPGRSLAVSWGVLLATALNTACAAPPAQEKPGPPEVEIGKFTFASERLQALFERFGASVPQPRGEETIKALLDSPESFRDTALSEQDRLEERVREQFDNGKLIGKLITPAGWNSRDGAPPDLPPGTKPLTKQQRNEILADALSAVNGRRALIRGNYRQMHAAAVAAFPLREALQAVDRRK